MVNAGGVQRKFTLCSEGRASQYPPTGFMDLQEVYLKNIQADFLYFCHYAHNHGRAMDDLLWYPSKLHKFLCRKVQEFVETDSGKSFSILILNTPPQVGKLQADETPILTRNGWKNHGDLEVGDEVLNHKGEWVKVTHVFPKGEANVKVGFTNGEEILCHENHEWVVYDRDCHCERILETKEIAKRVTHDEKKRRYVFQLPHRDFVKGDEKGLPVPPYVLGAWLGDGQNVSGQICASEGDRIVLDTVREYYPDGKEWTHKDTGVLYATFNGLYKGLQKYGMCHSRRRTEKHIPDDYLTASVEQRLELLAGLIDTDGSLHRRTNRMYFCTADVELKETFIELISTFGWRASVSERKPSVSTSGVRGRRTYWQIGFNPTCEIPCRIERKRIRTFSKQRRVSFSYVEEIEPVRGNCIEVEGGIYLCGKTMIPTHNSTTVTETFPVWWLMRNPDKGVIEVSYGDDLAERFGKANLEKLEQFGYIFGVKPDKKKATAREFQIAGHKGKMISKGYGSALTGNTGNLILIDDPVKNAVEADSERDRDKKWADFQRSILTRAGAGDKIILIMTRWHEDDLAGRIMENYADKTTVINIPCECEDEEDPLGRKIGDSICPEIGKDNAWLKDFKASLIDEEGRRTWNALYQGRPTEREGNVLKRDWWEYYERKDYENGTLVFDRMIMSVDATFKDRKNNDFVAITVWGKKDNRIYLVDLINERFNFTETIRAIRMMKARHPRVLNILIEDKANGSAIIQVLREEMFGITAITPHESKEARVDAVSFAIECGNVYLPKDKNFTWEFIEQCAAFPNGKHDDIVDSMSMALARLIFSKKHTPPEQKWFSREKTFHVKTRNTGLGAGERIHVI